ncbi:MAG: DUF302 domain-containing protein [Candidatus Krumholzibacteria bacterium]|nr:DUF302 domain-containing protein [Candidatus Krumholzibacteria bacterium]
MQDLIAAAEKHQFGLLHEHNLRQTMRHKGIEFPHRVHVLEICNPHHAASILNEDIRVNMALPCRIGVWEKDGQTMVGTILPTQLLQVFGDSPTIAETATQVENAMLAIIDDAI